MENIDHKTARRWMENLRAKELAAAEHGEFEIMFIFREKWQKLLPHASEEDKEFFQAPTWRGLQVETNPGTYYWITEESEGWRLFDAKVGLHRRTSEPGLDETAAKVWAEGAILEIPPDERVGDRVARLWGPVAIPTLDDEEVATL